MHTNQTADIDALEDAVEAVADAQLEQAQREAVRALASPLDRSLQRPSARPSAPLQSLHEAHPLNTPSLTLDPRVLAALPEYDDTTKGYLGAAETAMSTMHLAVSTVVSMREASLRNPTWTPAAAVINVAVEVSKIQEKATRQADAALTALGRGIASIEAELSAPVAASANTPLGGEIASYCRSLSAGDRLSFLSNAIQDGDTTTMHAVLSRPPYLSGLTKEMQATLTEQLRRKTQPEKARLLALMQGARERLEAAGSLFLLQLEQAMGVKGGWAQVQKLRAAQANAMKPFSTKS